MSSTQPEWMKKFQEIGQKGDEEVTAVVNDGIVRTVEPSKRVDLDDTDAPVVTRSAVNDDDNNNDVDDNDDDDAAAAMFRSVGSETGTRSGGEDPPAAEEQPETEISTHIPMLPDGEEVKDNNDNQEVVLDQGRISPIGLYERTLSAAKDNSEHEKSSMSSSTVPVPSRVTETTNNDDKITYEEGKEEEEEKTEEVPRFGTADSKAMEDQETDFGASWVVDPNKLSNKETTMPRSYMTEEEITEDEDGNELVPPHQLQQRGENDGKRYEENTPVMGGYDDDYLSRNNNRNTPAYTTSRNEGVNKTTTNVTRIDANKEQAIRRSKAAAAYDIEQQRQRILRSPEKGKRSRMSWVIPILVFLLLASAILLVVFFVVLNEDRTISPLTPTIAPTPTKYLPMDPTISTSGNVDAAATTEFDPVQKNCDFDTLNQPNIIDQCDCDDGYVDILADDIITRWNYYVEDFIPSIYPQWTEPIDSCSSENQALLWLSSGINNGGEINNLHRLQRYILAVVYYQQGGTEWSRSTNWLSEKSICVWEGVECNDNSFVLVLNLNQNRLTGQLSDAPTILNAIEGYYVANNNLFGSIPKSYFENGTLRSVDFSDNALSGELSSFSRRTMLTDINLAMNSLKGIVPSSIKNAADLTIFNVESNAFSGTLPDSLFDLPLTDLAIGGNIFTGTTPVGLSGVSTLTSLSLGPNLFTGEIATSLSELTNLVQLSMIGIPDLGGRLPASFGLSLTNLVELSIAETSVEGDIPLQFSLMTNLEILRLNNNSLARNIPSSLGLLTNLESLHLNENAFSGTVPSEMGSLSVLQELQLHSNRLTGTIPEEIGNLVDIRTLTFDGNFMDGRTPIGVCALRDAELNKFIVDCPSLLGESQIVVGIICSVPNCCTECI